MRWGAHGRLQPRAGPVLVSACRAGSASLRVGPLARPRPACARPAAHHRRRSLLPDRPPPDRSKHGTPTWGILASSIGVAGIVL